MRPVSGNRTLPLLAADILLCSLLLMACLFCGCGQDSGQSVDYNSPSNTDIQQLDTGESISEDPEEAEKIGYQDGYDQGKEDGLGGEQSSSVTPPDSDYESTEAQDAYSAGYESGYESGVEAAQEMLQERDNQGSEEDNW